MNKIFAELTQHFAKASGKKKIDIAASCARA